MALGGYCEACGRWVWVDRRTGSCQFGHPARAVRDVQQLRAKGRSLPARQSLTPAARRPWIVWGWRHSLWVAWTFNPGLVNWVAFLYIGVRAQRTLWLVWSLVYLLPLLLTISAIGTEFLGLAIAVQLLVAVISIGHALWVRPQYQALMLGAPPAGEPVPPFLWSPGRRNLPRGMDEGVAEIIHEAEAELVEISRQGAQIAKPEVRAAVGRLGATAEQILEQLRKEPRKAGLARGFLSYYLEAALRIVRGYAELSSAPSDSPEVRRTLVQAEAALAEVQRAFDRQLQDLLQQQLLELDSEIALLEKTVQMDRRLASGPAAPAALPPGPSEPQARAETPPGAPPASAQSPAPGRPAAGDAIGPAALPAPPTVPPTAPLSSGSAEMGEAPVGTRR
jgi:hypothetical protein